MSKTGFRVVCFVGVIGFLSPALATEQVYHPISPALGGASANGPFLLSTAQSQGEGVNSSNQSQSPTINITNPTTPTITGGGATTAGANTSGVNGATPQTTRGTVANPLSGNSGMF